MYNDTVTIFNRQGTEKGGFTWYPTTLSNVDLIIDKGANMQRMGTDKADTAKLHIAYKDTELGMELGDKIYLPPKEWATREEYSTTLTFNEGVDFFMLGDYPSEPIADADYVKTNSNSFYDYLNRTKDFVFKITNVGTYKLIPHFEIGGE